MYKVRSSLASCDDGGLETISQSKLTEQRFVQITYGFLYPRGQLYERWIALLTGK